MLNSLQSELNNLVNIGLDRQLRLAVTGLSRSGKTAFITSLVNQLLQLDPQNNAHLPFFEAAAKKKILAVERVSQRNMNIPRFAYEKNIQNLSAQPPHWPQSTDGVSEIRLAICYQNNHPILRHLQEKATLYLDIFDYPGEWLLDLPLLDMSFQQWSQSQQGEFAVRRQQLAEHWLSLAKQLDLTAPCNEEQLAKIAEAYTDYLHSCKAQGLHLIQPGRFVLPGELAGAPTLQFFPLPHLSPQQWLDLVKQAPKNSNFAQLNQRYEYYRKHIVQSFYQDHFTHFDRQVILVDCLTPLNHSYQAFMDMREGLLQLFNSFQYGQRSLFNRFFSPNIDKLMFIASKADHITSEQVPNLISLMQQLLQDAKRHLTFKNIQIASNAVASICATKQVRIEQNGKIFKALQGIRSSDLKKVTLYPGSVPHKLPSPNFWQQHQFEFDQFEPQVWQNSAPIPHLRMDTVLQFLLADKF